MFSVCALAEYSRLLRICPYLPFPSCCSVYFNKTHSIFSLYFAPDITGRWACKHCCSVPLRFRAPGSVVQQKPTQQQIERHLEVCAGGNFYTPNVASAPSDRSASSTTFATGSVPVAAATTSMRRIERPAPSQSVASIPPPPQVAKEHPYAPTYGHHPTQQHIQQHYNPVQYRPPSMAVAMHPPQYYPHSATPTAVYSVPTAPTMAHAPPHAPVYNHYPNVTDNGASSKYHNVSGQRQDTVRLPDDANTSDPLVFSEDKAILTDYFFFLMKQFKPCKFTDSDRTAKGRKRDNIPTGFAGIQCRHCASLCDGRKFFWSNVDRLANSFTEIPAHLLKCRKCPPSVRDAVFEMKKDHLEQMARLPRGSQKVFFRRMWRRLHEKEKIAKKSGSNSGNEEENSESKIATTPGSVLLSVPEDRDWLSDMDCFVRKNLEVFMASKDDINLLHAEKKYRVVEGQVGMRCIHCAASEDGAKGSAVFFPYMICDIFEFVREFQKNHLNVDAARRNNGECKMVCLEVPSSESHSPHLCPHMPDHLKAELSSLTKTVSSLNSMLKRYSILAAKALGLYDTNAGIRAKNDSILNGASVSLDLLANIASTR